MTKRITAALFAVILILSIAILPAYAESTYNYKLDDAANVLNPNEKSQLLSTIKEVSDTCKCNLAFVTVNDINGASFSHNGTTQDYADRYYEKEYGKNTDGIVVLLVLNNGKGKRDIYISTSGKCIKRLTDSENAPASEMVYAPVGVFDRLRYRDAHPDVHEEAAQER